MSLIDCINDDLAACGHVDRYTCTYTQTHPPVHSVSRSPIPGEAAIRNPPSCHSGETTEPRSRLRPSPRPPMTCLTRAAIPSVFVDADETEGRPGILQRTYVCCQGPNLLGKSLGRVLGELQWMKKKPTRTGQDRGGEAWIESVGSACSAHEHRENDGGRKRAGLRMHLRSGLGGGTWGVGELAGRQKGRLRGQWGS